MFAGLEGAPPDPILGLMDAFRADPRSDKVNLAVGVYQDESGMTPVLASVKEAEKRLLAEERTKEYLGIMGHPAFPKVIPPLLFGDHEFASDSSGPAVSTFQTPGGTGGLRVVADFLREVAPGCTVWLSDPTWPNHPGIFQTAGLSTKTYPYLDASRAAVDLSGVLDALRQAQSGDAVVLHGCCHNPTGVDLPLPAWNAIGDVIVAKSLIPIVDLAYLGFAEGLGEDAAPMRSLLRQVPGGFVCVSFSKNFGLYRERVGALIYASANPGEVETVASRLKRCIRVNYSNPPGHGGSIVAMILGDDGLRRVWEREVEAMRTRLASLRTGFSQALREAGFTKNVDAIPSQHGMFSLLDVSPTQVDRLRQDFGIYLVRSGRVNFAGMRANNMQRVARAFAAVG